MEPPFNENTRTLLNFITRHFLETAGQTSGKRLRRECVMDREPFDAAIAPLLPAFVQRSGAMFDDRYSPTLRGVLESTFATRAVTLIDSVLGCLRHEFSANPDVQRFSWEKVRGVDESLTEADFRPLISLVDLAQMYSHSYDWSPEPKSFNFRVPDDVEDVVKLDVKEFIASRVGRIEKLEFDSSDSEALPLPEVLQKNALGRAEVTGQSIAPSQPSLDNLPQWPVDDTGTLDLVEPFDPAKIRIETKVMTIDLLLKRLKESEIDLMPDFQREGGLWKDREQSRLIESLLVRIPIPAFYMDATNEEHWLVVDGLQRMTVFKRFILDDSLSLSQLEFLRQFEGMRFRQLPRPMQRRIEETQVTVSLILPGTPDDVRYYLFKRINTGGLPLTPQEIRHALNQGPASILLASLASEKEFVSATGGSLRAQRMADRECVLRFFAFRLTKLEKYHSQDLDGFLNGAMRQMNKMDSGALDELSRSFRRAMNAAHDIFGRYAFRKRTLPSDRMNPINKAMFETWSVNLSLCSDVELARLVKMREQVNNESMSLLLMDREFDLSVTQSTGDAKRVRTRFERVAELLRGIL